MGKIVLVCMTFVLSGCGVVGELERPDPIFGDPSEVSALSQAGHLNGRGDPLSLDFNRPDDAGNT